MDAAALERLEIRARVIKAVAHPTRLFLVEQLRREPCCVRDLTKRVGADISTVSRHLGVLREAGIVDSERRGQQMLYRLRAPCILGLLDCIEGVLRGDEAPAS